MQQRMAGQSLSVSACGRGVGLLVTLVLVASVMAGGPTVRSVYDAGVDGVVPPLTPLDRLVVADLETHGFRMAAPASDEVFIRRVHVDVLGVIPRSEEVLAFVADRKPDKRARLIDRLLEDPRFADRWASKWCNLLRVKAEFPINLWPNGAQAYHRWVHDAIARNKRYDAFVRELLTSSGSNFRNPPVNFFRAVQGREPANLAAAVALTFMGSRIDTWAPEQRAGLELLLSRVSYKPTAEWKEEIVLLNPAVYEPLEATLPDGKKVVVPAGEDPRQVFADWLIREDNPWFARTAVNRAWFWLVGRGIVHEPDDLRADNPPVNPQLLAYLESEFVHAKYDLKHLYRLILNSRTYQQSCVPAGGSEASGERLSEVQRRFGCYIVRRMEAETLCDAIDGLFGRGDGYVSPIPEPFTFLPSYLRAYQLADGSITSTFLELFGRPTRDTGLESERGLDSTARQRLYLLNSSHMQRKIERSAVVREWVNRSRNDDGKLVESIYLGVLSRRPTAEEVDAARRYIKATREGRAAAAIDLTWALVNSREFLFRH